MSKSVADKISSPTGKKLVAATGVLVMFLSLKRLQGIPTKKTPGTDAPLMHLLHSVPVQSALVFVGTIAGVSIIQRRQTVQRSSPQSISDIPVAFVTIVNNDPTPPLSTEDAIEAKQEIDNEMKKAAQSTMADTAATGEIIQLACAYDKQADGTCKKGFNLSKDEKCCELGGLTTRDQILETTKTVVIEAILPAVAEELLVRSPKLFSKSKLLIAKIKARVLKTQLGKMAGRKLGKSAATKLGLKAAKTAARLGGKIIGKTVAKIATKIGVKLAAMAAKISASASTGPLAIAYAAFEVLSMLADILDPAGFENFTANKAIENLKHVEEVRMAAGLKQQRQSYPQLFSVSVMYPKEFIEAYERMYGQAYQDAMAFLTEDHCEDYFLAIMAKLDALPDTATEQDMEAVQDSVPMTDTMTDFLEMKVGELMKNTVQRDQKILTELQKIKTVNASYITLAPGFSNADTIGIGLTVQGAEYWNGSKRQEWFQHYDQFEQKPLPEDYIQSPFACYTDTYHILNENDPGTHEKPNVFEQKLNNKAVLAMPFGNIMSYCEKPRHLGIMGSKHKIPGNGVDPAKLGVKFDVSGRCMMSIDYCTKFALKYEGDKFNGAGECVGYPGQDVAELLFGKTVTRGFVAVGQEVEKLVGKTPQCRSGEHQRGLDCYRDPGAGRELTTPGGMLHGKVCPSNTTTNAVACDRGVGTLPIKGGHSIHTVGRGSGYAEHSVARGVGYAMNGSIGRKSYGEHSVARGAGYAVNGSIGRANYSEWHIHVRPGYNYFFTNGMANCEREHGRGNCKNIGAIAYPKCPKLMGQTHGVRDNGLGCVMGALQHCEKTHGRGNCETTSPGFASHKCSKVSPGSTSSGPLTCWLGAKEHCEQHEGEGNCEQHGAMYYKKCSLVEPGSSATTANFCKIGAKENCEKQHGANKCEYVSPGIWAHKCDLVRPGSTGSGPLTCLLGSKEHCEENEGVGNCEQHGAMHYKKCSLVEPGSTATTANFCKIGAKEHCEKNEGKDNCEQHGLMWYRKCSLVHKGSSATTANFCERSGKIGCEEEYGVGECNEVAGIYYPKDGNERCPEGREWHAGMCYKKVPGFNCNVTMCDRNIQSLQKRGGVDTCPPGYDMENGMCWPKKRDGVSGAVSSRVVTLSSNAGGRPAGGPGQRPGRARAEKGVETRIARGGDKGVSSYDGNDDYKDTYNSTTTTSKSTSKLVSTKEVAGLVGVLLLMKRLSA